MTRTVLAALAATLAFAAPAQAQTDTVDGVTLASMADAPTERVFSLQPLTASYDSARFISQAHRWVDRSRVPMPNVPVRIRRGDCQVDGGELLAGGPCALAPIRLIFLPALGGNERGDFYHEVGHVYDEWMLTPEDRARYQAISGNHGDWDAWQDNHGSPSEQFAEAYNTCATRRKVGDGYEGTHAFTTTPETHRAVCMFIRQQYHRVTGVKFTPPKPRKPRWP